MTKLFSTISLSLFLVLAAYGQTEDVVKQPAPPSSLLADGEEGPNEVALADAFSSLSSGAHTNYANGRQNILDQSSLAWQTECHYFAEGGKVDVFGKSANDNDSWRHIQFDEATETWTDKTNNGPNSPGTISAFGHIYGNSTMNSENGDLYLLSGNEGTIRWYRRATDDWTQIESGPWTTTSQKNGLAYHPNLFGTDDGGLVMGTANSIWLWRASTSTWIQLSGYGSNGTKEGIGIYHPIGDYVLLKGRGTSLFKVPAGFDGNYRSPVNLGPPPIDTGGLSGNNESGTVLPFPDGSARLMLIENWNGSDRWWISSDEGDTWAIQDSKHGLHGGSPTEQGVGGPFCSMKGYGGVWAVSETEARIWKP